MKKRCQTGVYLLLYILLLTYIAGFDITRLLDIKSCFRPMLYAFCIRLILVNEDMKDFLPNTTEDKSKEMETAPPHTMPSHEDCRFAGLTRRETEVALLICQKYSNREIAEILVISETTVKKHISNIFEKTGIERREELTDYLTHNSAG